MLHFSQYVIENEIKLRYPYSSGHVHVPGPKHLTQIVNTNDPIEPLLLKDEDKFITGGYFCLKEAVPREVVEKTKAYINNLTERADAIFKDIFSLILSLNQQKPVIIINIKLNNSVTGQDEIPKIWSFFSIGGVIKVCIIL